jgi:hypothetical protein
MLVDDRIAALRTGLLSRLHGGPLFVGLGRKCGALPAALHRLWSRLFFCNMGMALKKRGKSLIFSWMFQWTHHPYPLVNKQFAIENCNL